MNEFQTRLNDTIKRLDLNETDAAAMLGCPITTLRKWTRGEREPSASAAKLLEVLGMVEVMAPSIHAALVPRTSPSGFREPKKRKPKT